MQINRYVTGDQIKWAEEVVTLIFSTLMLYFLVLSYKLRKINYTIAEVKKLSKPLIKLDKIITRIKKTKTVEELDANLLDSIIKWPQFELIISREYRNRKADLLPPSPQ